MNLIDLKQIKGWKVCPACREGYLREIKDDEQIVGLHCLDCDIDYEVLNGEEMI